MKCQLLEALAVAQAPFACVLAGCHLLSSSVRQAIFFTLKPPLSFPGNWQLSLNRTAQCAGGASGVDIIFRAAMGTDCRKPLACQEQSTGRNLPLREWRVFLSLY